MFKCLKQLKKKEKIFYLNEKKTVIFSTLSKSAGTERNRYVYEYGVIGCEINK
jgi:hypothetical protein